MATTEVIWLEILGVSFYSLIFINSFSQNREVLAVGRWELNFSHQWGTAWFCLKGKIWQPTRLFGLLNFSNIVSSFVPIAAINSQQLSFFKELFSCFGVKTIEPRLVFLPFRLLTLSTARHFTFS